MLWKPSPHTDPKHSFQKIMYHKLNFYLFDNWANKTSGTYVYDKSDPIITCADTVTHDTIEKEIIHLVNDDDLASTHYEDLWITLYDASNNPIPGPSSSQPSITEKFKRLYFLRCLVNHMKIDAEYTYPLTASRPFTHHYKPQSSYWIYNLVSFLLLVSIGVYGYTRMGIIYGSVLVIPCLFLYFISLSL